MTDYTDPLVRDAEEREAAEDAYYENNPHACGACGFMIYPAEGPHRCDLDPGCEACGVPYIDDCECLGPRGPHGRIQDDIDRPSTWVRDSGF